MKRLSVWLGAMCAVCLALADGAHAQGQVTAQDEAMNTLRAGVPREQDRSIVDDWIALQLSKLRDALGNPILIPGARKDFYASFNTQYNHEGNTPAFKQMFAQQVGAMFAKEYAKGQQLEPTLARAGHVAGVEGAHLSASVGLAAHPLGPVEAIHEVVHVLELDRRLATEERHQLGQRASQRAHRVERGLRRATQLGQDAVQVPEQVVGERVEHGFTHLGQRHPQHQALVMGRVGQAGGQRRRPCGAAARGARIQAEARPRGGVHARVQVAELRQDRVPGISG